MKVNDDMKEKLTTYQKALERRKISRQIQQLSWALNKIESKFNIDDLDDNSLKQLINIYDRAFQDIQEITEAIELLQD